MKSKFLNEIRRFFSSLCYLGYIPGAPGTVGSLVVIALLYWQMDRVAPYFKTDHITLFYCVYCAFVAVCVFFSSNARQIFGSDDPKQVIIDECAGQLVTFLFVPLSWRVLVLGFVLFRFFDIVKPFPVYKMQDVDGGLGIVLDDVIAGVMANFCLLGLLWMFHAIKVYL